MQAPAAAHAVAERRETRAAPRAHATPAGRPPANASKRDRHERAPGRECLQPKPRRKEISVYSSQMSSGSAHSSGALVSYRSRALRSLAAAGRPPPRLHHARPSSARSIQPRPLSRREPPGAEARGAHAGSIAHTSRRGVARRHQPPAASPRPPPLSAAVPAIPCETRRALRRMPILLRGRRGRAGIRLRARSCCIPWGLTSLLSHWYRDIPAR